jgi:serum/glucocorticoid-regulated kinase 2
MEVSGVIFSSTNSQKHLLLILLCSSRVVSVPEPIQRALNTHALAASMSTSANALAMQAKRQSGAPTMTSNRDSVQRKQQWWLPYVVLEFDKNEVLIDALGGDLAAPVWMYSATL